MIRPDESHSSEAEMFWAELAPTEHMVQLYEHEEVFLDTLSGFVSGGIKSGDGVVIIATPDHIAALEKRLNENGVDVDGVRSEDRYITCDAEETLRKFMPENWPDEELFKVVVADLLIRAGTDGRKVRAFGEMVALMWAKGYNAATVRLEFLWHELCREKQFSLLCSYPKSGFTDDANDSIKLICSAHSKLIH